MDRFRRKIRPFSQKNKGPTETILHFFSRFPSFSRFVPSQAVYCQTQATIQPFQKKSCQKHYRRFYGRPRICHNHRMTVEMTGRNGGCKGWTAVKRRPALREASWSAERQFRFRAPRWKAALARPHSKTCRPFRRQSHPITPNQS